MSVAQTPKLVANLSSCAYTTISCTAGAGGADGKPSKCVVEVEKIKRRRQQRRAAQVVAREQQQDPNYIADALLPGYGYDVMIASVHTACTVRCCGQGFYWRLSVCLFSARYLKNRWSPKLTQKCHTMSPGKPFILGSIDQKSRSRGKKNSTGMDLVTFCTLVNAGFF